MITVKRTKLSKLTVAALGAVIIALCSWLSIPAPVPFTLQTFAVFLLLSTLGSKTGTVSILVYILLGAVGIPVFHGFTGGVGILFGATGGYIVGFLLTGLICIAAEKILAGKAASMHIAFILGLAVCYIAGTLWFVAVYTKTSSATTFAAALKMCVVPFILPDLVKLAAALILGKRLKKLIRFI